MLNALRDIYGVNIDDGAAYRKFITALMRNLSKLATNGKTTRCLNRILTYFLLW